MPELRACRTQAGKLLHPLEDLRRDGWIDEIKIIREMGYAGYFLITWDFIRYAREARDPGRAGPRLGGRVARRLLHAGSPNIDPLEYNLLFERFLNPERVSDAGHRHRLLFPHRRERVIDYVTDKYGRDNVAQIITFRDDGGAGVSFATSARAGDPIREVDRIAKLVPGEPGKEITIAEALATCRSSRRRTNRTPTARQGVARRWRNAWRADAPCLDPCRRRRDRAEADRRVRAALRGTKDGDEITTQFAKDEIEEIGLLKLDFLGAEDA